MKRRACITALIMASAYIVAPQAHSGSLFGDAVRNGARQAMQERQAKQSRPQQPVPEATRNAPKSRRPPLMENPEFDLEAHQKCGSALGFAGASIEALRLKRDVFKSRNDAVIAIGHAAARLLLSEKDRSNIELVLELTPEERALNEAVDSDLNRMILHGNPAGINFVTQKKQRIFEAQNNSAERQNARKELANLDSQEAELMSRLRDADIALSAYDEARISYEAAAFEAVTSVGPEDASLDRLLMLERDYTILASCREKGGKPGPLSEPVFSRKASELTPVLRARLEKAKTISTTARQYSQAIAPYKYSILLAKATPQIAELLAETRVTLASLEASDLRLEQQKATKLRLAREAEARTHAVSMLAKGPISADAQTALATAWMESFSGYAILPSVYSVEGPTMTANAGLLQVDTFSVTDMRCAKTGAVSFGCSYHLSAQRSVALGPFALADAQIFSVQRQDQFVLSNGEWQVDSVKPFYKGILASIAGTRSNTYGDAEDERVRQWNNHMQTQRNTQEWVDAINHGF